MGCRDLRKSIGVALKALLCQRFADLVSRLSDANDAPTGGCLTIQYKGYDQWTGGAEVRNVRADSVHYQDNDPDGHGIGEMRTRE